MTATFSSLRTAQARVADPAAAMPAGARPSVPGLELELVGYSGARVLLLREPGGWPFVRKIAGSAGQNERLKSQASKQQRVGRLLAGLASTPEILGEGEIEGRYFFDMSYVRGLDGISWLRTAGFEGVSRFARSLIAVMEAFAGTREEQRGPFDFRRAVFDKCSSVAGTLRDLDPEAASAVDRLVAALHDWRPGLLEPCMCHGDFTLENLIVTPSGELILIDLLDSYLDHWLADVAKLGQDLQAGWYLRHHPPLAMSVVHYLRTEIERAVVKFDGDERNLAVVQVLIATNLARILPYAKTSAERRFVYHRMLHFTSNIETSHLASLEKT